MIRVVLLGSVCLALVSLSGCHLCHKKHHAHVECDPCACTTSVSGPGRCTRAVVVRNHQSCSDQRRAADPAEGDCHAPGIMIPPIVSQRPGVAECSTGGARAMEEEASLLDQDSRHVSRAATLPTCAVDSRPVDAGGRNRALTGTISEFGLVATAKRLVLAIVTFVCPRVRERRVLVRQPEAQMSDPTASNVSCMYTLRRASPRFACTSKSWPYSRRWWVSGRSADATLVPSGRRPREPADEPVPSPRPRPRCRLRPRRRWVRRNVMAPVATRALAPAHGVLYRQNEGKRRWPHAGAERSRARPENKAMTNRESWPQSPGLGCPPRPGSTRRNRRAETPECTTALAASATLIAHARKSGINARPAWYRVAAADPLHVQRHINVQPEQDRPEKHAPHQRRGDRRPGHQIQRQDRV